MKRYYVTIFVFLAIIAGCIVYIYDYITDEFGEVQGAQAESPPGALSLAESDIFQDSAMNWEITGQDEQIKDEEMPPVYRLYDAGELAGEFDSFDNAVEAGKGYRFAGITFDEEFYRTVDSNELFTSLDELFIWENYPPFLTETDDGRIEGGDSFAEAAELAKDNGSVFFRNTGSAIWTRDTPVEGGYRISGVPLIGQYPELPRGCEVTSLAMLMDYYGTKVDKMTLAEEIAKDETPLSFENGKKRFGNPNTGFVGDMYSLDNDGLAVYHGPVFDLLKNYFPDNAVDITGCDFSDLYYFLNNDMPVWIIVTSRYRWLEPSFFTTWSTPIGDIDVTYQVHSVLITGYDDNFIYFNDPFERAEKYAKSDFIAGWEQMGSQAIIIAK